MLKTLPFAGIFNKYPALFLDTAVIALQGEKYAAKYLKKLGWRIIARNLSVGHYEIDILAMSPDEQILSVIEVRTSGNPKTDPALTIHQSKKQNLIAASAQFKKIS